MVGKNHKALISVTNITRNTIGPESEQTITLISPAKVIPQIRGKEAINLISHSLFHLCTGGWKSNRSSKKYFINSSKNYIELSSILKLKRTFSLAYHVLQFL